MRRIHHLFVMRLGAVLALVGLATGCSGSKGTEDGSNCRDAECFGVCVANGAWDGMDESFWSLDAYCVDNSTCECASGCDSNKCNSYCVDEMGGTGGSCDIFSCVCEGIPDDAGTPEDGGNPGDAGPDASI